MIEVIYSVENKSRKTYHDDSMEFIEDAIDHIKDMFTYAEAKAVVLAKQRNWKITPGIMYIRQFNKMDGESYTFRSATDIFNICIKYDLFQE